jgi:hypothetical protein
MSRKKRKMRKVARLRLIFFQKSDFLRLPYAFFAATIVSVENPNWFLCTLNNRQHKLSNCEKLDFKTQKSKYFLPLMPISRRFYAYLIKKMGKNDLPNSFYQKYSKACCKY